jgi:hypothetical protein
MDAFGEYDYRRVEQYLQRGFNPNFAQYFRTILLTGSEINSDVDPENIASVSSPLQLAINNMDFTLITLLLQYGADVNYNGAFRSLLSAFVAIRAYQVNNNNNAMDLVDRNRGRVMIKYIEQVMYLITKYGQPDLSIHDHTYERPCHHIVSLYREVPILHVCPKTHQRQPEHELLLLSTT